MGKPGRHLAEDAHLTRGFQGLLLLAQQHIVTLEQPATTTDQQHHPDVVECEQQQNHRCGPHYQLMLDKPAFDIQPQLTLLRVLANVTEQRFDLAGRGGSSPAKRRILWGIKQNPGDAIGKFITHCWQCGEGPVRIKRRAAQAGNRRRMVEHHLKIGFMDQPFFIHFFQQTYRHNHGLNGLLTQ